MGVGKSCDSASRTARSPPPTMRHWWASTPSGLEGEQPSQKRLDRQHRPEVLRSDDVLRDAEIELAFDGEHEVDHLDRTHAKLAQAGVHCNRLRFPGLAEDLRNQGQ